MQKDLSQNNGFTLGYQGRHHGYTPGSPVKPSPRKPRHVKAGIGAFNGTISGMRRDKGAVSLAPRK